MVDFLANIFLDRVKDGVNWCIDSAIAEAGYAWNCKQHIAELRVAVDQLKEKRSKLLRDKEDAERKGETIVPGVDQWLNDTKQFIQSAEEFLTLEDSPKIKCCVVMSPNCKSRYVRGRKAKAEMLEEFKTHTTNCDNLPEISYREGTPSLRPVKEYESFDSRASICKNIMEAMSDPSVNKIGLYGINGVGKTTLVTQLAKQALGKKLFDEVAMATVFKSHNNKEMQGGMAVLNEQDIERIQEEIGEGLGFTFHSRTVFGRERELRERLKDGKKKLLVLDDIWGKFELERVGIPDDCEILMTSINQTVLSQMGSENNCMLDKLQFDEAQDWFNRMVGVVFQNPDLQDVAEQVADKCEGLPILLIPVAKGLKGNVDVNTWNESLEELSRFDQNEMHADVNLALQLSYNLLGGDEIKSLFRLCGQDNDPIYIEDLFKYAFGLGLLTQSNTAGNSRSQLLTFVKKLKDSCLLLEGNSSELLQMHETVRNFAVSIASSDYGVFTVAPYTTLSAWPEENVLRNLTSVSLKYCNILDLPQVLDCPKLESFFLSSNDPSLKIPDNFFKGMRNLKVLDLTNIHFSQLPPSLSILKDLRTLCLDWCVLKDIKVIGELKKLQVLSMVGSDISELPKELQQLSNLRVLDLHNCKSPTLIEVRLMEVLSSLGKLEELCMKDTVLQSSGISTGLAKLKHLKKLDIHITDVKMLPKGKFWEDLKWFRIFIGEGWNWSGEYKTPTTLKIKLDTSIKWDMGLKSLLKKTEDLYLDELKGIKGSIYELDVSGFRQLKHLHVENSSDIQFIVKSTRTCDAFTSLESLFLDNLQKLKKICDAPLTPVSFSKLRVLDVGDCGAIESVISSSMVEGLLRLEEIKITDCRSLKEIITEDGKYDAGSTKPIELPQLRKLVLNSLPQFSRFCFMSQRRRNTPETSARLEETVHEIEKEKPMPLFTERILVPNLKELELSSIIIDKIWNEHMTEVTGLQNLTSLIMNGCNNLKYLFSSALLESLVNLQTLLVSNCRMMQQVVLTEASGEGMDKVTFRQLEVLQLQDLPELAQVCTSNLFECTALKELSVMNCPRLRCFVSKYGQENKAASSQVEPPNLPLFDEKVALPNLEELRITNMNRVTMIWHNELLDDSFSKLKQLYISNAEELVNVFPSNYMLSTFNNVMTLSIAHCDSLEEIFGFEAITNSTHSRVATQLKTLELENLPNLKHICSKGAVETLSFLNLRNVNVLECPKMKSVFPASVARDLLQLTYVDIKNCGIEEIVSKEEGEDLLVDFYFPELTRLTLWRLPELTRFYPGTHRAEYPKLKYVNVYDCAKVELFTSESQEGKIKSSSGQPLLSAEKIIPNLEELTLNSKDVRMLWEGQFPADQLCNVKVLYLQCFEDESTPFPFGLIQRFNNLETLDIGDSCFKEIFANDGFADLEDDETYLKKLQVLRLDSLHDLKQIRLVNMFKNLETLQVYYCHNLTILAPESASFQNLVVLDVQSCDGLVNLMTSSTAKSLVQLKEMSVMNCKVLKQILANEEDEEKAEINFHKLESLRLDCLSSLTNFCSVVSSLRFPSLEKVFLKQCPRMRDFSQGDLHTPKLRIVQTEEGREKTRWMGDLNATVQQLYSELDGFNGIEQMDLSEFPELKDRWPDQLPVRFFDKLKSLVVNDFAFSSAAISSNILPSLDVLEKLTVRNCNSVEEIFDFPDAPLYTQYLSKLTMLELVDLPNLKQVWNENAKRMLDFEKLKQIKIHKCSSLRCIFTPSMLTSLNKLQEIEVKGCSAMEEIVGKEAEHDTIVFPKLTNITFEDLPNITCFYSGNGICEFPSLTMFTIIDCPKTFTSSFLGGKEQSTSNEATEAKIIIPNLKEMKLSSILIDKIWDVKFPKISSCTQNLTSLIVDGCDNLKYMFSSSIVESLVNLKTLKVMNCGMMEEIIVKEGFGEEIWHVAFSQLEILWLENLPKLTQVCSCDLFECTALKELKVVNFPKLSAFVSTFEGEILPSSNDLDQTNFSLFDEKVAFPNLERLEINDINCVKMIWDDTQQENSFSKLKQLSISNVEELVGIFPSTYVLSKFTNLEDLSIASCNSLENIIGFEAIRNATHKETATEVKAPELRRLSNMKYVWNNDDVEILSLLNIQKVEVSDCPNLKSIFPASVAKVLLQLTSISIEDCGIEEIVSAEVGKESVLDFAFPRLTLIKLWRLPELKRFYPGPHRAEFPELKNLSIYNCEKFGVFTTEPQFVENQIGSSQEQPLLTAEKVIPRLEELSLNQNDARMLWEGQFPADLLCNVTFLSLHSFDDESKMAPSGLIQRFNSLETLEIINCCFREIFLNDGFVVQEDPTNNLEKLRVLKLNTLHNLKQIKGHHELKRLEDLEVWYCASLTNLALPSAFQNLKVLDVNGCGGLVSLITSSTAENLVQLTKLSVKNCEKLREILANEGKADITFHKLESLRLDCLKSLTNFCSTVCTLRFPALEEVVLKQCPKMTIFSTGELHAPQLKMVETEGTVYKPQWMGDLNATVKQMYAELAGFDGVSEMKLSEFPELKIKWPDELPIQFFGNLQSLVVDDCALCSTAVPSELLPCLNVLKELEVTNCDSVEQVFDVGQPKGAISTGHLSSLTKFHLVDLPKLKHLCTQNVKEMLDLRALKEIKIQNCGSLRYVFTPFMLLGLIHLQEIEVSSCPALEEIVAKEAEHNAIVFPTLKSITLENLSSITCFHSGNGVCEFPSLTMVALIDCPKTFTSSFLGTQELSISTEAKIIIPNLEEMKLSSILIDRTWDVKVLETPSSLQSLTSLTVDGCNNLKYLFSPLIVEILVNLKTLQVMNCEMLEEVIFSKGFGEEMRHVTFSQLQLLRLDNLPQLTQVCCCDLFECLALKELIIESCMELRSFILTPGKENEFLHHFNFSSFFFDEKVAFPNLEKLEIADMDYVKMVWHELLQENSFSKLKQLSISNSEGLEGIFPSHYVLSKFTNLEELSIENCSSLREIFGFEATTSATQKMVAIEGKIPELSNMTNICDNDDVEILSLLNIQKVDVSECPNLKSIFPACVAKVLLQLTSISVTDCEIEEIVSSEVGNESVVDFAFPQLTDIKLWELPELQRFYPGLHTAEFPKLKNLSIYNCEKFGVFTTASESSENQIESSQEQPLLSAEKVIPTLEELTLNQNDARMLWEAQFPEDLFCNVTYLSLNCFHDESTMFPSALIQRFNSLDTLEIINCCFREIFLHDGFKNQTNQTRNLDKVRFLKLIRLYNLKQITGDYVLKSLEDLEISNCGSLTHLALPSAFQNLKVLNVDGCGGLLILMTSSTSKSLVQLTELSIANCRKLREILRNKRNADITFHKLESLTLDSLPSLTNFCSAICTLGFPALEKVILKQCSKMQVFSKGNLHAPMLEMVETEGTVYEPQPMGGLNAVVKQIYAELNESTECEDIASNSKENETHISSQNLNVDIAANKEEVSPDSSFPINQASNVSHSHATAFEQNLESGTTLVEQVQEIVVPKEMTSKDLHASKYPNADEDRIAEREITEEVPSEKLSMKNSTTEVKIIDLASDSQATTTNNEKDSTEVDGTVRKSMENDIHMSSKNLNDDKAPKKDEISPNTSTLQNEASDVSHLLTSVEHATTSVSNTISFQGPSDTIASKSTSNSPPSQIAEMSVHSAAPVEHLFASKDKLPVPASSSKLTSSSIASADLPESISFNPEHTYRDHIALLKNILIRPLSEVSRSHDVHLLLSTLENLKNSAHLNYQQSELIRYYIEHFDTLVTYHSFYEDEIGRASALEKSVQDDMKGMPELKILHENLANKANGLSAEKEILKKRLQEVEEEEEKVRSDMESLRAKVVTKNMKQDALPKASMRQKEAEDKARSGNDHWTKMRDLFA